MFTVFRRTDSPIDGNPILQRVGFTWHTVLPQYRWALTSPFHPYQNRRLITQYSMQTQSHFGGIFLLHYPGGHPRLTVSGTLSYAARTFLMIFWSRDRITNSNHWRLSPTIILYHFFAKNASIFLLFFEKNSRIIGEFRSINSMFHK